MKIRVLVVKTSSLGDVIHTLPALTDAAKAIDGIQFDWVVEEAFAEIPAWHPAVDRVIHVALRRWRRTPFKSLMGREWRDFLLALRVHRYDYIIDAQGLLKSAWLARKAQGPLYGLDRHSAREPLASLFYKQKVAVERELHAVTRVRRLFAKILGYDFDEQHVDYGIDLSRFKRDAVKPYLLFLHGTTWPNKHWPESYWNELAQQVRDAGYALHLPWGNRVERQRAERIAEGKAHVTVLPKLDLAGMAAEIANAAAVVGADTGLSHLAAACGVPSVTLYGPTQPGLTGTVGERQLHLQAEFECAPCMKRRCHYEGEAPVQPACFQTIPPSRVWQALAPLLEEGRG